MRAFLMVALALTLLGTTAPCGPNDLGRLGQAPDRQPQFKVNATALSSNKVTPPF
jgi:hypothetical protein